MLEQVLSIVKDFEPVLSIVEKWNLYVSSIIFFVVAMLLNLIFYKKFAKWQIKRLQTGIISNSASDFIPYLWIKDNSYIQNKDNSFSAILEFQGFPFHQENDFTKIEQEIYNAKQKALNNLDNQDTLFVKVITSKHKKQYGINEPEQGYSIRYFIALTSNSLAELKTLTASLLIYLKLFQPVLLSNNLLFEFLYSNVNRYYKRDALNFEPNITLNFQLSISSLDFFPNIAIGLLDNIEKGKEYFACFAINFGSIINSQYFHDLISADLDFELILNSQLLNKTETDALMHNDNINIRASNNNNENAFSRFFTTSLQKEAEYQSIDELLQNEETKITYLDTFVFLFAPSLVELKLKTKTLQFLLTKYDLKLIQQTKNLNFCFFQRYIGFKLHAKGIYSRLQLLAPNSHTFLYAHKVLSNVLSNMFDFSHLPKGLTKSDWGEYPVAILNTHNNNEYKFFFHENENNTSLAHGIIIAPSGAGKTTSMAFFQKNILNNYTNIDVYNFDRFSGLEIFTHWQKGTNFNFDTNPINPLAIDLNQQEVISSLQALNIPFDKDLVNSLLIQNIEFLNSWLALISNSQNTFEQKTIFNLVNTLTFIAKPKRTLTLLFANIAENFSSLIPKLHPWAKGKYASFINAPFMNEEDNNQASLSLFANNLFTFQMDNIINDPELSSAILLFILFGIRQKSRIFNRPHFIFIDETSAFLKNVFFKEQLEILLKEHRKLRGAVWLAFQNTTDFLNDHSLKTLLLNQSANILLFQSDVINANRDILTQLNIDNSLFNSLNSTIKQTKNPYFAILKRKQENLILNLDLKTSLKDDLPLLSSSNDKVLLVRNLLKSNPNNWVHEYLQHSFTQ